MAQGLNELTTTELKQYLSQNRNDSGAFRAGLQIMMNRSGGAHRHPSPLSMAAPEATFTAPLKDHLAQSS
jgi:hypothetical protein